MKQLRTFAIAALLAAAASLVTAQEHGDKKDAKPAEAAKAELPKCVVSDHPANLFVKTDTPEGPVYFCCKDCQAPYTKEPTKYADKLAAQHAALAKMPKVQVACPLSAEPIDKKVFIEADGQKILFCCNDCKGKFDPKNPEHKAKLAGSYTYQTQCPMMEETIDPTSFTDLPTGERVYWCCDKCGTSYVKKLDVFAERLAAQGYKVDVAALKAKLEKAGG